MDVTDGVDMPHARHVVRAHSAGGNRRLVAARRQMKVGETMESDGHGSQVIKRRRAQRRGALRGLQRQALDERNLRRAARTARHVTRSSRHLSFASTAAAPDDGDSRVYHKRTWLWLAETISTYLCIVLESCDVWDVVSTASNYCGRAADLDDAGELGLDDEESSEKEEEEHEERGLNDRARHDDTEQTGASGDRHYESDAQSHLQAGKAGHAHARPRVVDNVPQSPARRRMDGYEHTTARQMAKEEAKRHKKEWQASRLCASMGLETIMVVLSCGSATEYMAAVSGGNDNLPRLYRAGEYMMAAAWRLQKRVCGEDWKEVRTAFRRHVTAVAQECGVSMEAFESNTLSQAQRHAICRHLSFPVFLKAMFSLYQLTKSDALREREGCKALFDMLMMHQREGVTWLYTCRVTGTGPIVADEMGMGKTIQILGFLSCLKENDELGRVLIVCPATVVEQWVAECHKWTPLLRICILGANGTYKGARMSEANLLRQVGKEGDILIMTYEALRTRLDSDASFQQFHRYLEDGTWDTMVLDEGHRISNPNTVLSQRIRTVRTKQRIILTGTPIQNNLMEMWSLFDFCNPNCLGTADDFRTKIVMPIRRGSSKGASLREQSSAHHIAESLRELTRVYMCRRVKGNMVDALPPVRELTICCPLTSLQQELYERFVDDTVGMGGSVTRLRSRGNETTHIYCVLRRLSDLCNHPFTYDETLKHHYRGLRGVDDMLTEYEHALDGVTQSQGNVSRHHWYRLSGKMVELDRLLRAHVGEKGDRVLIFSQFPRVLRLLRLYLQQKRPSWRVLYMDGVTSMRERMQQVRSFCREEADIFLLSKRVGGMGLNLTAANVVVLFDPAWNPTIDAQAMDRACRIGQKQRVTVYRFVAAGTIEEYMLYLQAFKTALAQFMLNGAASFCSTCPTGEFMTYLKFNIMSDLGQRVYGTRKQAVAVNSCVKEARGDEASTRRRRDTCGSGRARRIDGGRDGGTSRTGDEMETAGHWPVVTVPQPDAQSSGGAPGEWNDESDDEDIWGDTSGGVAPVFGTGESSRDVSSALQRAETRLSQTGVADAVNVGASMRKMVLETVCGSDGQGHTDALADHMRAKVCKRREARFRAWNEMDKMYA